MQVISPLYSGGGQLYIPDNNIKSSRELLSRYSVAITQAETIVGQSKKLKSDYGSFDELTKKTLNIILPSNVNEIMITDEFSEFVKASNLNVSDFSIGKALTSPYPDLGYYSGSITVSGSYEDLKAMLRHIEGSLRYYDITSFSYAISEKDEMNSSLKVNFQTYYLK